MTSTHVVPEMGIAERAAFLESILESSTEHSIIAKDLGGLILAWNEGARRSYGYTAEETIGKLNARSLHAAEDVESGLARALLDTALATGKADGVFERVRKDGQRFTASVAVTLRRAVDGTPIGYVLITRDITEQRRLEAQLRAKNDELQVQHRRVEEADRLESELLATVSHPADDPCGPLLEAEAARACRGVLVQFHAISSIFDALDVVLYVSDMHTHEMLFVNTYTTRLWGADCLGRRCYEVMQADQTAPCQFCTNQALVTPEGEPGPPVVWEFQNTVTDRWYLCIDKAIPWTDGRLVRMEVAVDITERKEAERFRQQYVSVISHDLCNPLSAIMMRASVLVRELEQQGLVREATRAGALLTNAQRMSALLTDLLETTRLESGHIQLHPHATDLGALARRVAEHVGSTEDSARVAVEVAGTVVATADEGRLERVLENLLTNAFRYSASGSPVTVRVAAGEAEVVVAVEDRGRGVPAEELPRLFERFYRASTSRSVEGLGLGLYNSRLIIELHGGRIWVESQVGIGSVFSFALPLASSA